MPLKCEPHTGIFPTSNCSETPFNSSQRPFTAALCKISTGCSNVARFMGVAPSIIFLTPCLLRAVIPPAHVIQSTMTMRWRMLTYEPSKDTTPCISFKSAARAASTPYVFLIAQMSLHLMCLCPMARMECMCPRSMPSVSITNSSPSVRIDTLGIFEEPLIVVSMSDLTY